MNQLIHDLYPHVKHIITWLTVEIGATPENSLSTGTPIDTRETVRAPGQGQLPFILKMARAMPCVFI